MARLTRQHVLRAISEFKRKGLERFYRDYGFWKSTRYDLIYRGKPYPPKAIYGRARAIADARTSILLYGGRQTNEPLERLGFEIVDKRDASLTVPDREADGLITRSIQARRSQHRFRQMLLKLYNGQCAITRCRVRELLEAAHVKPYSGAGDYRPQNGLLLRADIHTLFDLGLIKIHPHSLSVRVDERISDPQYRKLHATVCSMPLTKSDQVDVNFLKQRWN